MTSDDTLLRTEDLTKHFPAGKDRLLRAVDGVSLQIARGETLGLVGESGCGKSTLGRLICRLEEPTRGRIWLDGTDLLALPPADLRRLRPRMQMIFQDPFASLNPHKTVEQIVSLPLRIGGVRAAAEVRRRLHELLDHVGLDPSQASRFPHQFSGGQRQRIGIARALACEPDLIIADEPVASLDVSIQAQILDILRGLQGRFHLTAVFISHDISVVSHVSQRIAVMYLGKIVEMSDTEDLFTHPLHPYTEALLSAVPVPDPAAKRERIILKGDVPSPINPPDYCRFYDRGCPRRMTICRMREPQLVETRPGHTCACFAVNPPAHAAPVVLTPEP